MELNFKLSNENLIRLEKFTNESTEYCIFPGLNAKGEFSSTTVLGATKSGIFLLDDLGDEFYPFESIENITNRTQTNGAILTVTKNGEEFLLARCTLKEVSRFSGFIRGAKLLLKGENEKKIVLREREKYCIKCGRVLPGTAKCPKCDKSGRNLKRFVALCKPYKWILLAITLLMFTDSGINLLQGQILRVFMDDHLIAGSGTVSDVLQFFAVYFGVIIFGLVVYFLKAYLCGSLGVKVGFRLRKELSDHLQKLSLSFLSSRNNGEVVERVIGDTSRVKGFISDAMCSAFNQAVTIIAVAIVLLVMNWKLALITFVFAPFVLIFTKTFWPKIHKIFHRQWRKTDSCQNRLQDILSGIRIVKTYGKEGEETKKFIALNEELAKIQHKNEKFFATFYPIITLLLTLSTYLIMYFGGLDVLGGSMTPGELMQFVTYTGMLLGPLSWMSFLPRRIVQTTTSLERIYDVLDETPEIISKENAVKKEIKGNIDINDIVFGYRSYEPVLEGVSLSVKPGEMIGLVGASGTGKSTLINLVMRLYDTDEGEILIDGTDIKDWDVENYHSQIGVVLQETFLFAGSVMDNICFAKPTATKKEVILAAKAANAHDFICKLPDGYNTYIGEKGHKLSGGEKQRIAIARAILNGPKLLILDEATSSLDTESEYQVQTALERLRKNRTTIAIAHRLSTLRNADRIAVIEGKKIAEIGTHNELLKKRGIYYSLVTAQLQMSKTAEKV